MASILRLNKQQEKNSPPAPPESSEAMPAPPPTLPTFVATPTAQLILSWLEITRHMGGLGVLRGRPGVGKTSALRHYLALHRNHVRTVELNAVVGSRRAILDAICDSLSIRQSMPPHQQLRTATRAIQAITAGTFESEPVLLILDEAQHLTPDALSIVRALSDASGCGVFLAGNHGVLRGSRVGSFQGGDWVGELSQIKSRVGVWQELLSPQYEDVAAYAAAIGVSDADEAALAILWQAACKPGGLRNVEKLVKTSIAMVADGVSPLTAAALDRAWATGGMHAEERFE